MRSRLLVVALWAGLGLGVEDGQFEREYSRLYMGIVLVIALLLLLIIGGTIRALVGGHE